MDNHTVFGNRKSGIVHALFCPFHPAEENLLIFEELYQALGEGFRECNYCFGNGEYWPRLDICYQCEVSFSLWDNFCPHLDWDEDQSYCLLKKKKRS